jgi:hypothetical protein
MEESNAWRNPIDLIELLEAAFQSLPDAMRVGIARRTDSPRSVWNGRTALAQQLLSDDPQANIDALLDALREGATAEQLAGTVAYAAALRVARFHTANEFTDWDTVLHTFTFANAIHHGIRRIVSAEQDRATPGVAPELRALPLLRGVLDAAMSVYLDRFLNIPPARIPQPQANGTAPETILAGLLPMLDQQQQVNQAGELVARYLAQGSGVRGQGSGVGDQESEVGGQEMGSRTGQLLAMLGKALLREDRNFHTIQMIEAAFAQHALLGDTPEAQHVLIAAARYLAAHAPTARAQEQTFQIAERLHRGELLYEEA